MIRFNLIFRNVRRSFKDYMIYFLTLVLGVSLFYAFNSISSQPALSDLNYAMEMFKDSLITYISLLSNFIAVILAFLIIYANQFIMKRRKKELGIYMSLGMNKWQISSIFAREIFLIGLFSLVVGIGLGIILAQGISILALKIFAGDASGFELMFSPNAMIETIINFSIIFILVALFNTRNILNIKLIDLLTSNRKNQELKVHNKFVTIILFLLSLVFLSMGITFLYNFGENKDNLSWILAIIGTGIILFYYTASSVMMILVKKNKKMYYNKLNTFFFRQLGSKMQTNFLLMIVLCGLLLSSLVVLGTGFSTTNSMNKQASLSTPFNLTILSPFKGDGSPLNKANKDKIPLKSSLRNYAESILYKTDLTYKDLFQGQDLNLSENDKRLINSHVTFISVTDYNKQMELSKNEKIQLKEDQYIINANNDNTQKNIRFLLKNNKEITVNGHVLTPMQKNELENIIFLTRSTTKNDMGTIIIPDDVANTLTSYSYLLNGNFKSNKKESMIYEQFNDKWLDQYLNGDLFYVTKSVIYDSYFGTFGVIAFISSYLGMILMIVTLSILSLQQLTEAEDNKERYQTLSKIGANKAMIKGALFKQIGFYFITPLILASFLSVFFIRYMLNKLEPFFDVPLSQNMLISLCVIFLLYIIYFIATYQSAKQIIIENKIK